MSVRAWVLLIAAATGFIGSVLSAELSNGAEPPQPNVVATSGLPLHLLVDAIGTRKLVLLGEMHGTKEIPALVGDLVSRQRRAEKKLILALEITSNDQTLVDGYLASTGKPADRAALLAGEHWQKPTHDGRDSQAMFALIERMGRLRKSGADVSIDFFDVPGDGDRDKHMADHLRSLLQRSPKATVLVLTGNIHAMTARPPWQMLNDGKQIEPPMTAGGYVADLRPLSINISAGSGEIWACMGDSCGVHAMPAAGAISAPTLEYAEPSTSAWNATLTLPTFSASPPEVSAYSE